MKTTKSPKKFSTEEVKRVAILANLPLTGQQEKDLTAQVGVTVQYVSQLQALPTSGVIETSQVTGLENVFREDEVDESRMFTQEEVLSNAKKTHNGYFVVDAVFEE